VDNIDELRNKIVTYEENTEHPDMNELLEEIALVAEVDSLNSSDDTVVLMTIHSAKGLEFPCVFLCGMEEGLFPGVMTINSGEKDDMEEERRLCYVGMTRAQNKLYLSSARQRMMHGSTSYNPISRFIKEIPQELMDMGGYRTTVNRTVIQKKEDSNVHGIFKTTSSQPAFGRTFAVNRAMTLDYGVGDRVKHIKFGIGVVQEIKNGGKDYEVSVEFENYGIKRMFASFAKLQKVE
jgi:DNA helicase-2/ATP-dependent DNA helicase PcrA